MKPVQTQGAGTGFDLIGDRTAIKPPEWLVENSFDGSVPTVATPNLDRLAARLGRPIQRPILVDELLRHMAEDESARQRDEAHRRLLEEQEAYRRWRAECLKLRPPGRRPPNKSRRHG